MKNIFDKIGYFLYIGLYIFLVINFGKLTLFETINIVFGDQVNGTVVSQSNINGKIIYGFSFRDEKVEKTYSSLPTNIKLVINEKKIIRIVPFFNVALLHDFNHFVYLISLAFFLFGLMVSIICLLILLNIKNKFTLLILKNI